MNQSPAANQSALNILLKSALNSPMKKVSILRACILTHRLILVPTWYDNSMLDWNDKT